jgi:hypothetical protein
MALDHPILAVYSKPLNCATDIGLHSRGDPALQKREGEQFAERFVHSRVTKHETARAKT